MNCSSLIILLIVTVLQMEVFPPPAPQSKFYTVIPVKEV